MKENTEMEDEYVESFDEMVQSLRRDAEADMGLAGLTTPVAITLGELHKRNAVIYLNIADRIEKTASKTRNCAELLAAVNQLRNWALQDILEGAIRSDEYNYRKLVDGIVEIADAALAKPPRQCDRPFVDGVDLEKAFRAEFCQMCGNYINRRQEPFKCFSCLPEWVLSKQHENKKGSGHADE